MANVQVSSGRTTFSPAQLNAQATKEQTPFVAFDNGVQYIVQADGNIVVYDGKGTALWAAKSNIGSGDASKLILRFQDDGNLVQYYDGKPKWNTDTAGKGKKLVLSDRAPFLMVLDKDANIVWNSKQDAAK